MKQVKYYRFWGINYPEPPSDFDKGAQMIAMIIFFPLWIIPFLIYKLICEVGKLDGEPKEIIKEVEEEETYY